MCSPFSISCMIKQLLWGRGEEKGTVVNLSAASPRVPARLGLCCLPRRGLGGMGGGKDIEGEEG